MRSTHLRERHMHPLESNSLKVVIICLALELPDGRADQLVRQPPTQTRCPDEVSDEDARWRAAYFLKVGTLLEAFSECLPCRKTVSRSTRTNWIVGLFMLFVLVHTAIYRFLPGFFARIDAQALMRAEISNTLVPQLLALPMAAKVQCFFMQATLTDPTLENRLSLHALAQVLESLEMLISG
jgi:hypothetical protein